MTEPRHSRITVVVATRDRWDDLCRSLPRHPRPVLVVDNGSRVPLADRVAQAFPDVTVIRLPCNAGAVARNEGVQASVTPYVAFADDDSWWEAGALERAADILDALPHLGLLAGRILVGDSGELEPVCAQMAASALGTRHGEPGPRVLGFIACGAVVRRAAYLEAGGFDPVTFFGGEEERLALDLAAAGWALCYAPQVVARHVPSTRRDVAARRVRVARNHVLTAVLRRPVRQVLRTVARTAKTGAGLLGLAAALPRLPAAVRARHRLPPEVEAARRLLDAG
jgi:GT2 family glycosyltransferase